MTTAPNRHWTQYQTVDNRNRIQLFAARTRVFCGVVAAMIAANACGTATKNSSAADAGERADTGNQADGGGLQDAGAQGAFIDLTWSCEDVHGMQKLVREQFGQSLTCTFSNAGVTLQYNRDDFRVAIQGLGADYHGPGTYVVHVNDRDWWPDYGSFFLAPDCFFDPGRSPLASLGDCSITVTEHSAERIAGTFTCSPVYRTPHLCGGCGDYTDHPEQYSGSFAYGPSDCQDYNAWRARIVRITRDRPVY